MARRRDSPPAAAPAPPQAPRRISAAGCAQPDWGYAYIAARRPAPRMGRARVAGIAVAAAVAAAAAIALASPLFYDTVVDEPPPLGADGLAGALGEVRAGLTLDEFSSMPDDERAPLVERMPERTVSMVMDAAARTPADAPGEGMPGAGGPPAAGDGGPDGDVRVTRTGQFEGVAGHRAEGTAKVISAGGGGGAEYLRFEDFEVTNGPDLRVYLTKAGDVDGGVHVAKLKGSRGDQNYDIAGLGADGYDTAVVYCQPFKVHFAQAVLSPADAGGG